MDDLIHGVIQRILSANIDYSTGLGHVLIISIDIILQIVFLRYSIIIPQLRIGRTRRRFDEKDFIAVWYIVCICSGLASIFRFEVWPALIGIVVLDYSIRNGTPRFLKKIVIFGNIESYVFFIKNFYIAFYEEYLVYKQKKPRKGRFFKDYATAYKFKSSKEATINLIFTDTVFPSSLQVIVFTVVIQIIGSMLLRDSVSKIPEKIFEGFVTGVATQMLVFYMGIILLINFYESNMLVPASDRVRQVRAEFEERVAPFSGKLGLKAFGKIMFLCGVFLAAIYMRFIYR